MDPDWDCRQVPLVEIRQRGVQLEGEPASRHGPHKNALIPGGYQVEIGDSLAKQLGQEDGQE